MGLIDRVVKIQEAEGLSDRDFAEDVLGISNGQWSGVKSGRIRVGRKTLKAIIKAYPGLRAEVEAYWLALLESAQDEPVIEVREAVA